MIVGMVKVVIGDGWGGLVVIMVKVVIGDSWVVVMMVKVVIGDSWGGSDDGKGGNW